MLSKTIGSASPTAADVARYMPLVRQVVARVMRRVPPNVQRDDLLSAGVYGLVDCLRRNDGSTGAAFEAYARIRIRGAVIDELRKVDFVPRHQRSNLQTARVVSLDVLSEEAHGADFADDAKTANVATLFDDLQDARALARAISALPQREQLIVRMRYFEARTIHEIATELCLSDPRVSQLHARAIARLREVMERA